MKEVSTDLQRDLHKAEKAIKSALSGRTEITIEKLEELQKQLQIAVTSVRYEIKYFDN